MDAILQQLKTLALTEGIPFLIKIVGALVLWFVGRSLIFGVRRLLHAGLERRKFDNTLIRYIESLFSGALTILLLLAILGMLGVETTSFAAVLAAAGIAIGTAWSGLLSNFAAGVFLLVLQPFRVGDVISAAGVTGKVHEMGLFVTTIDTGDNHRIFVGNNRLFGDNIVNTSVNPQCRVVARVPLMYGANVDGLIQALQERVKSVPNVLSSPAIVVDIAELTLAGPVVQIVAWATPGDAAPVQGALVAAAHEILTTTHYALPQQALPAFQKVG